MVYHGIYAGVGGADFETAVTWVRTEPQPLALTVRSIHLPPHRYSSHGPVRGRSLPQQPTRLDMERPPFPEERSDGWYTTRLTVPSRSGMVDA